MIAIFSGVICASVHGTRTSTTFRVFMSLSIRKKGHQKKKRETAVCLNADIV